MDRRLFAPTAMLLVLACIALANISNANAGQDGGDAYGTRAGLGAFSPANPLALLGSTFTYQGRLTDAGNPANGSYDLQFTLYDAPTGGNLAGGPLTVLSQTVSNGLFTVPLDFGSSAFQGAARWLEIAVRQAGGGSFVALSPRQAITAAPYALSLMPGAVVTGTLGSPLLSINNTGGGIAVQGVVSATNQAALYGANSGSSYGYGVRGDSPYGDGVYGYSNSANAGVHGNNDGTGSGVTGGSNSGFGVFGSSTSGTGVYGSTGSNTGVGVYGTGNGISGAGIYGTSTGSNGIGVEGVVSSTSSAVYGLNSTNSLVGYALRGDSPHGTGVYGTSNSPNGAVAGSNIGIGAGVLGASTSGNGVFGTSGTAGGSGVYGTNSADGAGVSGVISGTYSSTGVYGVNRGYGYGVRGDSNSYIGVYGSTSSNSTTWGALTGSASSGIGVYGTGGIYGVYGQNATGTGIYGISFANNGTGIIGTSNAGSSAIGVYGSSSSGTGVDGQTSGSASAGVRGSSSGVNGIGVYGSTSGGTSSIGVYGTSNIGYAGVFDGDVRVNGTLSKSAGSFKIDDPLDPANKYLSHSFVESPDMMDIYNGNVTTDVNGEAVIVMPDWFQALNRDFRYQLTAIGAPAPDLYIAQEIQGNSFKIAGGKPNMKVSWQVTGIRHDPFADQHRIPVEQDKPADEKGKYLYPQGYGQPDSKGVDYERQQQLQAQATPTPGEP